MNPRGKLLKLGITSGKNNANGIISRIFRMKFTFDSMPCGSPGYFGTAFDNLIKRKSILDSLTCVYTNLPGLFLQNCFPLYEIVTSTMPGCERAGV